MRLVADLFKPPCLLGYYPCISNPSSKDCAIIDACSKDLYFCKFAKLQFPDGTDISCKRYSFDNEGGIDGYIVYDETNTARTSNTSYGPNWYATSSTYWTIQFGSGTTAAQRNNYAIQTAFATAPESTKFQCGPGAYAAGVISFGNLITAGGSGTVDEIGLFNLCGWLTVGAAIQ